METPPPLNRDRVKHAETKGERIKNVFFFDHKTMIVSLIVSAHASPWLVFSPTEQNCSSFSYAIQLCVLPLIILIFSA